MRNSAFGGLTFEWDSRDVAFWKNEGDSTRIAQAVTRAVAKAGSEAARAMKTQAGRGVRERKRYRAARVNKALPLYFPTSKRILERLLWRMDVSGEPVPVADFPHRQTKKGVSVRINANKRALMKGAFVATMRNGHEGVFRRVGNPSLPIREAFTTRVSDVFKDGGTGAGGFIARVQARSQFVFSRAFNRLLPMELEKIK
jgi:hypothetical protein